MTTARTTTAQPIAASISIPDAILHSTAFARRKPLLLLKIVRQTDLRFSPASPGGAAAVRQTAQAAAQGPKSPSAQALAAPFRLRRESGTAERTPRQSRRPQAQERDEPLCGRRTALRKAFAPVRERPCGAYSFSLPGRPLSGPAFLRHASHSLPHSASPAAPDISLRARLYFAECRVFRNAAQLPPFASPWPHTRFPSAHVRASPSPTLLRIAAQSLIAVLDVFSCARRGRPFPPAPSSPGIRQLCPAPLFCRPSFRPIVSRD